MMNRRDLLKSAAALAAGAAGAAVPASLAQAPAATPPGAVRTPLPMPTAAKLPRWRGFNLFEMFHPEWSDGKFIETDFDWIAEWGFDFVRLPCSYWFWAKPEALYDIDEEPLKEIDKAIAWGRERRLHMNLNMHRIPGYCINPPAEPTNLYENDETLEAACHHWRMFAERYKGIPNNELSFDLMNEPPNVEDENFLRVHGALAEAIREVDPTRMIIADGKGGGHSPVENIASIGVAMSTRGYSPVRISHHKAEWINGSEHWPEPTWPLIEEHDGRKIVWDKDHLRQDRIAPWKKLEATGVGIHIGEWGTHNRTPHEVTLAWMKDNLELFQEAGWGWALWNFRGSFGILDSERLDVEYEDFRGHQLDRKMLELLRAH